MVNFRYAALAFILMCICTANVQADDAVKNTDLQTLLTKAKSGDVEAQVRLGLDYGRGAEGLTKDDSQLLFWLAQAGKKSNSTALYYLCMAYYHGNDVVKPDNIQAYMYDILFLKYSGSASVHMQENAALTRDKLEAVLSTDQIITVHAMAQQWMDQKTDSPPKL